MVESQRVGIEDIHAYVGRARIDIRELFEVRGLNLERFDNLMMRGKSVAFPFEDAVTNAVNAAKPILENLTEAERDQIEVVITATESAVDFGKSLSTYLVDLLGLSRRCRAFEIKQACYAGTAALQMAASYVAANPRPNVKALVVATDVPRAMAKHTYAEPSQSTVGVAMLVGRNPEILELDLGATGCYSYEVMDAYRPTSDTEEGDAQATLFSYLDCLVGSYQSYCNVVEDVDLMNSFDYLLFHTPFVGMVRGAHRKLLRKVLKASREQIADDFERRMLPALHFCQDVGNGYSASLYLALCGLLDAVSLQSPLRVGMFSYGSGCSSEFFSGIVRPEGKQKLQQRNLHRHIHSRKTISIQAYDNLLDRNAEVGFGVKEHVVDTRSIGELYAEVFEGQGWLILDRIDNYHRVYRWS